MTGRDDAEILERWNDMLARFTLETAIDTNKWQVVYVPVSVKEAREKDEQSRGSEEIVGATAGEEV